MKENEIIIFFQYLWEIWRDINSIEFLMRWAIMKHDNEEDLFPKPPYTKNKIYQNYPKAFSHLSFEILIEKFNKRFPKIVIPKELMELRNAMAHWIIADINNEWDEKLIKFIEENKKLKIECSLDLNIKKLKELNILLRSVRRLIMKEIKKA